ncbi:hypothetical protein Godav_020761 [Gossypium davidsonii]|uniref:Uncharacterized protein n=1 Tax=Gossypium davidsonii TaxID=34287 RepID=A0A7J8R4S1_GOSDV|nr:hypothetical protein [Gossypium davidsonii]
MYGCYETVYCRTLVLLRRPSFSFIFICLLRSFLWD